MRKTAIRMYSHGDSQHLEPASRGTLPTLTEITGNERGQS